MAIREVLVELKGVEKLDPSWIKLSKAGAAGALAAGHKAGRAFLEAKPTAIASNVVLGAGSSLSYSVTAALPRVLPPSYRGIAVRYHYYISVVVKWSPAGRAAGAAAGFSGARTPHPASVEARIPFRVWTLPECSGLTEDEADSELHYGAGGIVPISPVVVEIHSRSNSPQVNAEKAELLSAGEEDEGGPPSQAAAGQRDGDGAMERAMSYSDIASLPTTAAATTATATEFVKELEAGEMDEEVERRRRKSMSALPKSAPVSRQNTLGNGTPPRLHDSLEALSLERNSANASVGPMVGDLPLRSSGSGLSSSPPSPSGGSGLLGPYLNGRPSDEDVGLNTPTSPTVSLVRGRTYNIRMDDQILVKFTPRSPQSTYYLGDVVSGTLTFPGSAESRRCLEVSVLLETREVVNPLVLHSSRGSIGAAIVPKVQTEFHEVTVDLMSTHFLFTIPMDSPAAFATPLVSVQWSLRFEFVSSLRPKLPGELTSAALLTAAKTERGEWSMPIVVHAPLPRSKNPGGKGKKVAMARRGGYHPAAGSKRLSERSNPLATAGAQADLLERMESVGAL
eukprot:SM000013S26550  [mRNA]  locus=s13:1008743:1012022:+ [translate_table: standard]